VVPTRAAGIPLLFICRNGGLRVTVPPPPAVPIPSRDTTG
jgi:hypothetical protein